jgi:hypothetical protein
VINISGWDFDVAGSSDTLGFGKLYLCQITGPASKGKYSDGFPPHIKQSNPRLVQVKIRDSESGSLRYRKIQVRQFRGAIAMDDGRKGSDANVRVEAYFHGPGYVKYVI